VITYLIANYNNEKYIENSIKSALNQTIKSKICLVDDASTDNSLNIATKLLFPEGYSVYESEYKKLTDGQNCIIQLSENHGPSYARNCGIKETLSRSKYYAIMDADDENYPTKLEKCLNILEADENIGIVYADYDILNIETGNKIREYKHRFSKRHLLSECIIHSGSVIRTSVLNAVVEPTGWYDINLRTVEDWDLWLRMTDRCLVYHVPQALSLVRVHNNNSTNSVSKENWERNWRYVAEKTKRRHANKNI